MNPFTKTMIVTSLLLAAGAVYQISKISRQRDQAHLLAQTTEDAANQIQKLREQTAQTLASLTATQNEIESLRHQSKYTTKDSELTAWLGRVNRLKQFLRDSPQKGIPEMQYLNSNDWLSVTLDNPSDTNAKIRSALSKLREMAKMKPQIFKNIINGLQAYTKANHGDIPTDPLQLRPYLNPPLSDDVLQRYEIAPEVPGENDANGVIREGLHMTGNGRIVLQEKFPVDEDYDTWSGYTEKGGAAINSISQLGKTVNAAMDAYTKTNPGLKASTPEQLLPYFTTPVDQTKLKEYWDVDHR